MLSGFETLYGGQFTSLTQLTKSNYLVILSHQRSTAVSLETYPFMTYNNPLKPQSQIFKLKGIELPVRMHLSLGFESKACYDYERKYQVLKKQLPLSCLHFQESVCSLVMLVLN